MTLMPTGAPAIKLTALADVSGSSEEEKMGIVSKKSDCMGIKAYRNGESDHVHHQPVDMLHSR